MSKIVLFKPVIFICSILLFSIFYSCTEKSSTEYPNVIFILADDLGYGDLSCYGHPYALTPNIDKLANQGVLFTRCYAAATLCSPSRASIVTGVHPIRFKGLPSQFGISEFTHVTQIAKESGYKTGHFGKWHIGGNTEDENSPYGYDQLINIKPKSQLNNIKDVEIFNSALDFMETNKNAPFYINIWTHTPHFPIKPTTINKTKFEDIDFDHSQFGEWMIKEKFNKLKAANINIEQSITNYLAEIYSLDYQVGRITSWLRENNLLKNTIIVFTSDQGPSKISKNLTDERDPNADKLGYAGGLRGGKGDFYEGGIRVPFIISWPSRIPQNKVNEKSVISLLDWLPSFLSILEISIDSIATDGVNMMEEFEGIHSTHHRELYWKKFGESYPMAILDKEWKLISNNDSSLSLYNLTNDPFEQKDLSKVEIDIVDSLLFKLESWNEKESIKVKNNPVDMLLQKFNILGIQLEENQISTIRMIGNQVGFNSSFTITNSNRNLARKNMLKLRNAVKDSVLTDAQVLLLDQARPYDNITNPNTLKDMLPPR